MTRTKLTKDQKSQLLEWVGDGLRSDEIRYRAEKSNPPFFVSRALVDYYRKTRLFNYSELSGKTEGQILHEWRNRWVGTPKGKTNDERPAINSKPMFLYVLQESFKGLIKIGITSSLTERLRKLNTACPQEISLLGYAETNHAKSLEAHIHERFASKRVKGEWFGLNQSEIALILDFCNASIPVDCLEFDKLFVSN